MTKLIQVQNRKCPNCNSIGLFLFYEIQQVPAHSVLLHFTKQEAVSFPKGDIQLGYCNTCGFITNTSFNEDLQSYLSQKYEATQAYSQTFSTFHRDLALRLIKKYDLHQKRIIEIGCGQGEFLDLLCSLGGNHGVGYDPAYVGKKNTLKYQSQISFIKDYYSEENSQLHQGDFIVCKMTLEHIQEPYKFVKMIANTLHNQPKTIVFFQVPNVQKVLKDIAFWDIYYEHCSYFCQDSLNYLFQICGFEVLNNSVEYDEQYLMIEAKLVRKLSDTNDGIGSNDLSNLEKVISGFQTNIQPVLSGWNERIIKLTKAGKKIIIWGGGSKAVAFLSALNAYDDIDYVVDINPNKHGTFLAGTGHRVKPPEAVLKNKPDVVIVMNPMYMKEIGIMLDDMGISVELLSINDQYLQVT